MCDKFTLKHLAYNNNPLWEFLLVNINKSTIEARLQLIRKLYFKIADDLPLDSNSVKIYSVIVFEDTPYNVINEEVMLFPILKYFPKNMIWR